MVGTDGLATVVEFYEQAEVPVPQAKHELTVVETAGVPLVVVTDAE